MQEGDALAFRAEAGRLVDEADAGTAAALEGGIDVVHREADVVDAGAALLDELRDRRVGSLGFEQLDERIAGGESRDAGTVGIVERHLGHAEYVAVEGQDLVERAHGCRVAFLHPSAGNGVLIELSEKVE